MIHSNKPNLFLVGAPKCGTTALSSYLAGHPDIFMSEQAVAMAPGQDLLKAKEPGYYAEDQRDLFGGRPFSSRETYLAVFEQANASTQWLGEASVNYLASKVAIPNIAQDNPDAKFVVAVRNPVAIASGMHNQRVKEGAENILDFEVAWRAQGSRLEGANLPVGTNMSPAAFQYGELARIGTQLKRLYQHVPPEQVHVIVHDDFTSDPLHVYKQLLAFLDVPYDGRTEFNRVNASKSIGSPNFIRLVMWANRLRKRLGIPGMGKGLYKKVYRLGLTSGKKEMAPAFEQELKDYFRTEVDIISGLLGRDFQHWSQ